MYDDVDVIVPYAWYYTSICVEGPRMTTRNFRSASVSVRIRISHLPNTSVKRPLYVNPFGPFSLDWVNWLFKAPLSSVHERQIMYNKGGVVKINVLRQQPGYDWYISSRTTYLTVR
jgi:hypothetical protein